MIESISKPCEHTAQTHDAKTDPNMHLRLVLDCYEDMPMFQLGSRELLALTSHAETEVCCDPIKEVLREKLVADHFGVTVAMDILQTHKQDAMSAVNRKTAIVR